MTFSLKVYISNFYAPYSFKNIAIIFKLIIGKCKYQVLLVFLIIAHIKFFALSKNLKMLYNVSQTFLLEN